MTEFITPEIYSSIMERYKLSAEQRGSHTVNLRNRDRYRLEYKFADAVADATEYIEEQTGYKVRTLSHTFDDPDCASAIVIFDEPKPQPNKDRVLSHGSMG